MKKLISLCAVILLLGTAYTMAGSPNANVRLGMFGSYDNNPLRSIGHPFDIQNSFHDSSLIVTCTTPSPCSNILFSLSDITISTPLVYGINIPVNYEDPFDFQNSLHNDCVLIVSCTPGYSGRDILLISDMDISNIFGNYDFGIINTSASVQGTFDNVLGISNLYLPDGSTYTIVGQSSDGSDIVLITPEPATILLLCLGGLVLRKRK
jgi:hypothetical protein